MNKSEAKGKNCVLGSVPVTRKYYQNTSIPDPGWLVKGDNGFLHCGQADSTRTLRTALVTQCFQRRNYIGLKMKDGPLQTFWAGCGYVFLCH